MEYYILIFLLVISSCSDLLEDLLSVGGFYLSPSRLSVLLIFLFTMLFSVRNGIILIVSQKSKRIFFITGMFLLVVFASIFKSDNIIYSFKRLLNLASIFVLPILVYEYLFLAVTSYSAKQKFDRLIYIIIFVSTLLVIISFLQPVTKMFVVKEDVRALLGFSVLRVNSLFKDPNFFGYFLLLPFFITFFSLKEASAIHVKVSYFCIFLILCFAILMTGSNGTVLAVFLGFAYMLIDEVKIFNRFLLCKNILALILPPLLLIFVVSTHIELLLDSLIAHDTDIGSFTSRALTWYSGIMLFLDNPLFGVGPGNYVTAGKITYLSQLLPTHKLESIDALAGHSNYIEILAESGIFAFSLYCCIFLVILYDIDRNLQFYNNYHIRAIKYGLYASLMANMFLSYYSPMLFVVVGFLYYYYDTRSSKRELNL